MRRLNPARKATGLGIGQDGEKRQHPGGCSLGVGDRPTTNLPGVQSAQTEKGIQARAGVSGVGQDPRTVCRAPWGTVDLRGQPAGMMNQVDTTDSRILPTENPMRDHQWIILDQVG
jgi:hypothetical protein